MVRTIAEGGSAQRKSEDDMKEMRKVIEDKVAAYVPDDQQDDDAEFTGTEMISLSELLFTFANKGDICYLMCGLLASAAFGAALPGFNLFFGDMVDSMGTST